MKLKNKCKGYITPIQSGGIHFIAVKYKLLLFLPLLNYVLTSVLFYESLVAMLLSFTVWPQDGPIVLFNGPLHWIKLELFFNTLF